MEFPNTSWTILASATLNGDASGQHALNELCQAYWQPVAFFIRGRGVPSERVEDLTQDFFIQIMDSQFFKRADRLKGSFRSFMLSSLRHFLIDDLRSRNSQKRGGHLERATLQDHDIITGADELKFDQSWAERLFERSLSKIEQSVIEKRSPEAWEQLRRFLPGSPSATAPSYTDLSSTLAMTEGGAKTEVHRLRLQFRETLRAEVALTVGAPHEVDEELAHLRASLERSALL